MVWKGGGVVEVATTTGLRGWSEDGDQWHEIKLLGDVSSGRVLNIYDAFLVPMKGVSPIQVAGESGIV